MNPSSIVEIKCEDGSLLKGKHVFQRFYYCLGGLNEGFKYCKLIIGLNGTHLKSTNDGVLLNAVGIDGNNNFYPVDYDVVEAENYETWKWFIEFIIQDVEIVNDNGWTIMSDKQKVLIKVIEDLIPNAENKFC